MIHLYCTTDGDNWHGKTNWLDDGQDLDDWQGVTADTSDQVSALDLSGQNLNGTIPPQLGELASLTVLNLNHNNKLSGTIPPQLGNLTNLTQLYIFGTLKLSGRIPAQLGSLTGLTHLELGTNKLSGTIPSQLGNLTGLTYLSLSSNELTGTIPPVLGELASLTGLGLDTNKLSGTIPPQLGNLTSLTGLGLSLGANRLSGPIPPELGNLTSLTSFSLRDNRLSGPIPSELGNLTNLNGVFYLDTNQLTGPIPPELGNLTKLQNLVVTDNRLSGEIPTELGQLSTNLQRLYLNENQLSGTIPPQLGNLTSLTQLYLQDNKLSGEIPTELGQLSTNLQLLLLHRNELTGTIPPVLTNLTSLVYLFLHQNQLSGEIPTELGQLSTNLQYLVLHLNKLSGAIPTELGNLTNLRYLYLSDNQLTGAIPWTPIGSLTKLTRLYLNDNKLTGAIPTELGSLTDLEELGFWGNSQLTWTDISTELGQKVDRAALRSLYDRNNGRNWRNKEGWLDSQNPFSFSSWDGVTADDTTGRVSELNLRSNGLTGEITNALEVMGGLESLNLSYNRSLAGTLPVRLRNVASLASLDISCTRVSVPTDTDFRDWLSGDGFDFRRQPCPPPPQPPPVITFAQGVTAPIGKRLEAFPLTPHREEEGGHIVYRRRTINLPVTRDECSLPGDPALIISRRTLDRVRRITFELSETSPQDPPQGFSMEGCAAEIDPGITLRTGETVTVCMPPTEVQGKSYIYRYDESGGWKRLPSQMEKTVNEEELLCGETDSFSLFGVFIPVIDDESTEGVRSSGEDAEGNFPLTPVGEEGSFGYGDRTIDISVTGDVDPLSSNPAVIVSRSILDRVSEITFDLSEDSPDPPPGFRMEGLATEVDLGVTLEEEETVAVCLPPSEVEGKSYIYRYDEQGGEWKRLPSQMKTVNEEDLLCGETDSFSLFGVFIPVIESAQNVLHEEDAEDGFSLTPLGVGGNIVYGDRTIDISVTGDVDPSSSNPAVIVSRSILDRVEEITFDLSEVSPYDPPLGFRLEGFAVETDLRVTLGMGETVTVCLTSSGGEPDLYRYNDESEEWELLESRVEMDVNGEEMVCAEAGAVSLTGFFVEETGGCAIAAANGEGTVRWQGAVFNLLLTISVLLLIPGRSMSRL